MKASLHDWAFLREPGLRSVFKALGGEARATRVVGGAVRDALLGRKVTDADLATTFSPQEVIARSSAAGLKYAPTGIDHGTVTVIADGKPFEVTTLRRDVETDGRRAVVAFTTDWGEDAARRDFTMNALYCDVEGEVLDPLGGLADLRAGNVRFIGSAEDRIREDYLRILRFFRFFARYGEGRPDAEGLKACARLKSGIATLSAERVWAELKRLLSAPDPSRARLWMRTTDVLKVALPETWGIDAIPRLVAAEKDGKWPPDALLRLEAIVQPDSERIEGLGGRLRLSRAEVARLQAWAAAPEANPDLSDVELSKVAYRNSAVGLSDRLRLALARALDEGQRAIAARLEYQLAFLRSWERPTLPVSGKDLVAQGADPGPEIGKRLQELEERWIESGFSLGRDDLIGR
jgi:tRNA nucleotidyltransferase/poly(A) polymerase